MSFVICSYDRQSISGRVEYVDGWSCDRHFKSNCGIVL